MTEKGQWNIKTLSVHYITQFYEAYFITCHYVMGLEPAIENELQ